MPVSGETWGNAEQFPCCCVVGMLADADLTHQIAGTTLIADKNYYGRDFETTLTARASSTAVRTIG